MSLTRSLFTTTAVLAGSSAAMLMGGIARADTAPAPNPGLPGISAIEQLANVPAIAPQILQDATASLTGPAPAPAPAAPGASANITFPQTTVPATRPGQVVAPQPAPATSPDHLLPSTQVKLPTVPGLPVPLPQQVSLPGDLATLLPVAATNPAVVPGVTPAVVPGLTPAVTPGVPGVTPAVTPALPGPAGVAPVTGLIPDLSSLIPLSALP